MAIRDGRLNKGLTRSFLILNSSISFDRRLAPYDIKGSIAYAKALKRASIIDEKEESKLIKGLEQILNEIQEGRFIFREEDEDVHMNIERRLFEIIGETALKLHTGRSRNEQIVLDERLYLIDLTSSVIKKLKRILESLYTLAEKNLNTIIPSYTHMQQAQLISISHLFIAYYTALMRDLNRLKDYEKRLKVMPMGSGAVAGSTIDIDRNFFLEELGFEELSRNSIDAVSTRDFITEFLFISSLIFVTLSRISEDLIIYSTKEFGYIELPDELTTTSSLMPQKKNPDSLELIRGKSSKTISNLNSILILMKGLPYSYNRDLQEDKPGLFETADNLNVCLDVMKEIFESVKINRDRIEEAIKNSNGFFYATDMADYLVKKGMPFREAHKIVGRIVQDALKKGTELSKISLEEYRSYTTLFDSDIYSIFDPMTSVNAHNVYGGTAINRIKEVLEEIKTELNSL